MERVTWEYEEGTYREISRMLERIPELTEVLRHLLDLPNINNYLLFILLEGKHLPTWNNAGLLLINSFGTSYPTMQPKYKNSLKSVLLRYLREVPNGVEDGAGWIICQILRIDGFRNWQKLLSVFAMILDSEVLDRTRSMAAIVQICQNTAEVLDRRTLGISVIHNGVLTTKPIDALYPRLIKCISSDSYELKKLSLDAVSHYARSVSASRSNIIESLLSMWEADDLVFEACRDLCELYIAELPPDHLDGFFQKVTSSLKDPFSLRRRIYCWILGHCRKYLVEHDRLHLLKSAIEGTAMTMADGDMRVQQSAHMAFSQLFQDAGTEVVQHLESIFVRLSSALENHQTRGLYEAVGKLAIVVGSTLDKEPAYLDSFLIPALKARWECISPANGEEVFLLLQCISIVALAFKSLKSAQEANTLCLVILDRNKQSKVPRDASFAYSNRNELIVRSLEFLCELTETFGSKLSNWDRDESWSLLLTCCKDNEFSVRVKSFTLVGYLAMVDGTFERQQRIRWLTQLCPQELNNVMSALTPIVTDMLAMYL